MIVIFYLFGKMVMLLIIKEVMVEGVDRGNDEFILGLFNLRFLLNITGRYFVCNWKFSVRV